MNFTARAAFAVVTLVTATISDPMGAFAQYNHGGKIHQCVYPGSKVIHLCTIEDYNKLQNKKIVDDKQRRQKLEMEAEARAYKKIQQERKRNAPTTEHCFMKNGALVCKPA